MQLAPLLLGQHNVDLDFCVAKERNATAASSSSSAAAGGDAPAAAGDATGDAAKSVATIVHAVAAATTEDGKDVDVHAKNAADTVRQLCKERLARDAELAKAAMHNAKEVGLSHAVRLVTRTWTSSRLSSIDPCFYCKEFVMSANPTKRR
jgi:hypothetical protein